VRNILEVSIIVPVYNEERSIAKVLQGLSELSKDLEKEIIVIDDGSEDGTPAVLKELANRHTLRLVIHEENQGYGISIKEGIRKAKYSKILIVDADGTYPLEAIPKLLEHLNTKDMVVGARIGKKVNFPAVRRIAKSFLNKLASYLVNRNIPDLNSGLRVFDKKIALRFFSLLPEGFSFTSTLTLAFLSNGYSVKYVPIDYHPRKGGKSKFHPLNDTMNLFALIIRMVMYFNPLKVFLPLSLIIILLGLFILLYSAIVTGKVMDITSIIVITTGVQTAIIGLLADLIVKRSNL